MKSQTNCLFMLTILLSVGMCSAMQFANGSVETIKQGSDYTIQTYYHYWAFSDDTLTWIDSRNGWGNEQVIGAYLSDSTHAEFVTDPNAQEASQIAMDYPFVAYTEQTEEENYQIRVADITNDSLPVYSDIPVSGYWLYSLDVSGDYVTYTSDSAQIIIVDMDSFSEPQPYVIYDGSVNSSSYVYDTALDGNVLAWCEETYDEIEDTYHGSLSVADITDPNNPQITTTILPDDPEEEYNYGYLNSIDISGDWMVACGTLSGKTGLYAIHNFTDTNQENWDIVELWSNPCIDSSLQISNPQIDGNIVVWVLGGSGGYASAVNTGDTKKCKDCQGEQLVSASLNTSNSSLMAAYLIDSGNAVISVLQTADTTINESYDSADVKGTNVVWSRRYFDNSEESEYLEYTTGALQLGCGDAGYAYGDINRDCVINLGDLALMAASWMECTDPTDPTCQQGDVFENLY